MAIIHIPRLNRWFPANPGISVTEQSFELSPAFPDRSALIYPHLLGYRWHFLISNENARVDETALVEYRAKNLCRCLVF